MFHSFPRRFVPEAGRISSEKLQPTKTGIAVVRLLWSAVALVCLPWLGSSIQAQTAEFTQANKSSSAVTMQVPLGNYLGRGISLPVTLHYSTQGLWRIGFINSTYENVNGYQVLQPNAEAIYAEHSTAGWKTSLDVPEVEWPRQNDRYWYTGKPYAIGYLYPYTFRIARVFIHMPDGSTHELRKADAVYQDNNFIDTTGTFYAVDGSRMRYDSTGVTPVLYLPDGSRYVFNGSTTQFIDRNGNTLNYNATNRQWTDTIGRVIGMPWPMNPGAGDYPYSLPGMGSTSITYTLKFRNLSDVLLPDVAGQTLEPMSDYYLPTPSASPGPGNLPQGPLPAGSTMFSSSWEDPEDTSNAHNFTYVVGRGQSGNVNFNPVVLSEIDLPNGQSYHFSYNSYGELDKVIYPTGGYARYQYGNVPTVGGNSQPYAEGTRGLLSRWISPNGTGGSDEAQWQYVTSSSGNMISVTAPDGTRSDTYLYNQAVSQANNFGYGDARNGSPYDERIYSPNGTMLRRTLIDYAQSSVSYNKPVPPNTFNTGTYTAYRNARPIKTVGLILDTGGNALASTTTTGYDTTYDFTVGSDATSSSQSDFASVDQTTAQTGAINSIPTGSLVRSTQTTYLTGDANYRNRNILGLPISATIYDGAWNVVAQSTVSYDEGGQYALLNDYGSVTGWNDPGTNIRGNATSHASWLNTTNSWLTSHAQYDQCGNARNAWDAKGNQSQVEYSSTYAYAFPTLARTAVPDPTGQTGSSSAFQSTSVFDFNTGLATSATDANGFISIPEYNDSLCAPPEQCMLQAPLSRPRALCNTTM
jgi:hypothetical protein